MHRSNSRRRAAAPMLALAIVGCATLPPPAHEGWSTTVAAGESARNWGDLGRITGRGLGMIAFDHAIARTGTVSQLGELALFALTQTPQNPTPPDVCTGVPAPNTPVMSYEDWMKRCARRFVTAYGVGTSPFGISMRLASTRITRWTLDALGGAALFNHDVPFSGLMPFSFTASVGTSVTFGASWPRASVVTIGYRLQHFSNAGLTTPNSAIAAQSLVVKWLPRSTPGR